MCYAVAAMPRTARVLTIPRRNPSLEELERQRAEAMQAVENDRRIRNILLYGGMVGLFLLGMLTQYVFTHWL